jgi:hypothetical protein
VYWSNLLVRTNERLDAAASGKAISLSWVFRVALPGVVAILFFFIGLHYYLPVKPVTQGSIRSVVASLPEADLDSVLADPSRFHESLSVADLGENVFDVSSAQIREYFLQAGETQNALESLTDEQLSDVLATLDQKKNTRM